MAPNALADKSAFLQKSAVCFSSAASCSTFRPSPSSSPSLPSPSTNPRASPASSSPHQPSSSRLTGSSLHYAAAYPTPMEVYTPSSNASKSFSQLVPTSLSLTAGTHRPKSLPPGRNLRISAGGGMKLYHQAARHVSGNGTCGISASAPDSAASSASCHSPSSPTLPRHFLIGKMVVSPPPRNPPPPAAPVSSPTLAASSSCATVAAHTPFPATGGTSLHPPVVILHSKPYGLFGPLPKSLLREGHKQRIAGVDVLRLSDSTIIPRIENSSLQQMLQTDPSIFPALEAALTECVVFLYNEGIKPFAGEIAHQMRKRIEGGSWLPSEVVALAVAAKDVYPRVERRVKGEDGWVVLLKKELHPPNFDGFVDTRAREDCYSPEQWREFNRYFIEKMRMHATESGGSSAAAAAAAAQFTEGRYALAERLRAEIPMFQSMKLAHLIRMVQLASWKKLLTYRDKALVPVAACPVTAKEFAQRNCMNLRGSDKSAAALASIEQLLRALSCIVDPEPTGIFLAQLKDLVRWTTYERLDCMVLGHTKLQDLLMSEPFIRFYRLYTPEGNEHCTYVQSKKFPLPWGAVLHTKCSMLWNPEACPMDPSNEQQHFSLSDAGCCWQYKALVPLYAQQRTSINGPTHISSPESKGGEMPDGRAAVATNEKQSLPSLLNCMKKTRETRCDEVSPSQRLLCAVDTKAAVTAQPCITRGNAHAAGAAYTSGVGERISEEMDDEKGVQGVFHWVERDILKLLDDETRSTSPLSEGETMLYSLRNDGGLGRDIVLDDLEQKTFSSSPGGVLPRGQNSPPRKYRSDVLAEGAHGLQTSQTGSNNVATEPSLSAWYPSAFLEACCDNNESPSNSREQGSSAECTPSASAALLHMAAASQSSPCCCSALPGDEALTSKTVSQGKQKGYSVPSATSRKPAGEENYFSSPCVAAAAVPPTPASASVPCWHESNFKMRRIFKQSPSVEATGCVGKSCYLSASCISVSPYKREEDNMRTPSTSSDGVLHVSPPALRAGAGTGLKSSTEIGSKALQTRTLSHAKKHETLTDTFLPNIHDQCLLHE